MKPIIKITACILAALPIATALSSAATANSASPRVAVPVEPNVAVPAPGQYGYAGSWTVKGLLYDQFRLNVRLRNYGGGDYTARLGWGKGTCSGTLSWYTTGGGAIRVQLNGSSCSDYATVWTADRMICQAENYGFNNRVAVPRPGYGSRLSCTYLPGTRDYPATYVSLLRR